MKNIDLVIMAAGMGSRFGRLKQIEPLGPNDETLLDYAIYDAKNLGIHHVYLIVRESFREQVESLYRAKWPDIKLHFINQELTHTPNFFSTSQTRTKPWGTSHVLYCLKDMIKNPFIIMNADDFYGREALGKLYHALDKSSDEKKQFMISYPLINTLSGNGAVTRGICKTENNLLVNITETRNVIINDDKINSDNGEINKNALASMNLWGFTSKILKLCNHQVESFFQSQPSDKDEVLLPDLVQDSIKNNHIQVEVLTSSQEIFGMTFSEDKPRVQDKINNLINSGQYPHQLF